MSSKTRSNFNGADSSKALNYSSDPEYLVTHQREASFKLRLPENDLTTQSKRFSQQTRSDMKAESVCPGLKGPAQAKQNATTN